MNDSLLIEQLTHKVNQESVSLTVSILGETTKLDINNDKQTIRLRGVQKELRKQV